MNRKTPEPEWSEDILQYLAVAVMFAAILVIAMRLIDWAMSWWAMARWRVDIIRKRAEHLATVRAATEKEAIATAIKQFEIEPVRQNRITVEKISAGDDD
jgi:hypothetical protein